MLNTKAKYFCKPIYANIYLFLPDVAILSYSKSVHWPEKSQEEESEFFKGNMNYF